MKTLYLDRVKTELANLLECPEDLSKAGQLELIQDMMWNLTRAAESVVEGTPEEPRAEAYWVAHLKSALRGEGKVPSMASAIELLEDHGL